jgi:Ca2+-binding EF-hand superfamily protein
MFSEADKNDDGKIDFDEFVAMMLPATMLSP